MKLTKNRTVGMRKITPVKKEVITLKDTIKKYIWKGTLEKKEILKKEVISRKMQDIKEPADTTLIMEMAKNMGKKKVVADLKNGGMDINIIIC